VEAFEEQYEKLRGSRDSDTANKIYKELGNAKNSIMQALNMNKSLPQRVISKVTDTFSTSGSSSTSGLEEAKEKISEKASSWFSGSNSEEEAKSLKEKATSWFSGSGASEKAEEAKEKGSSWFSGASEKAEEAKDKASKATGSSSWFSGSSGKEAEDEAKSLKDKATSWFSGSSASEKAEEAKEKASGSGNVFSSTLSSAKETVVNASEQVKGTLSSIVGGSNKAEQWADSLKSEITKVADKFKDNSEVKKAMSSFESSFNNLKSTNNSSTAQKAYKELINARNSVFKSVEKASGSKLSDKISSKFQELEDQGNQLLKDFTEATSSKSKL